MKKILLFILLCLPVIMKAQETYGLLDNHKKKNKEKINKPEKNANQIVIHVSAQKDSLFDTIVMLLAERGYGIVSKDKEYGIISTDEKGLNNDINITTKINVVVKNGLALLKGQFKLNIGLSLGGVSSKPSFEEIKYKGMRGSAYRKAWDELSSIAALLKGQSIEYVIN